MPDTISPRSITLPAAQERLLALDNLRGTYDPWSENHSNTSPVGITFTSGGSADTAGSWVQIDASTEAEIFGIEIFTWGDTSTSGQNSSTLFDLGIGGAGSEAAILPSLQVGHLFKGVGYRIPIYIPAGSRLAGRVQGAVASKSVTLAFRPWTPPAYWKPASYTLAIGAVLASTRGTLLSAPGSANTKGSYQQLTAATTEKLAGFVVCVGSGNNNHIVGDFLLDIAMGAAASEIILVHDLFTHYTDSEDVEPFGMPRLYGVEIPAGARISARYQRSVFPGTNHNCHLIGIPWR